LQSFLLFSSSNSSSKQASKQIAPKLWIVEKKPSSSQSASLLEQQGNAYSWKQAKVVFFSSKSGFWQVYLIIIC